MEPQIQETDVATLLRQRSDIWRGSTGHHSRHVSVSSVFPALDDALGGGWPAGLITEIFSDSPGAVLRLLLPALRGLSRQAGWLAWIAPPLIPYPPGLLYHGIALEHILMIRPSSLKERLWAAEQCLRSGACSAMLLWLERSDFLTSRRLQLAAHGSRIPAFCLLPPGVQRSASAAALRLTIRPEPGPDARPDAEMGMELAIEILKCRTGSGGRRVCLSA
ncbi:MAG: translesion DNA synthesis-associated protein ImuA [Pseudomonadota bacterium]|nr:translesion DNA synthesis-associated protein ImuA [Pseudomonadota bacterium]